MTLQLQIQEVTIIKYKDYYIIIKFPKLSKIQYQNNVKIFTPYLQSVTKYLRLTPVFMWNSAAGEEFNRYISGLFC